MTDILTNYSQTTTYQGLNLSSLTASSLVVSDGSKNLSSLSYAPMTNSYWVDSINGNDTTGTGSILKPYQTIGKVATVIGGATNSTQFNDATLGYFNLKCTGTFTENPTFGTRPNIILDLSNGYISGNLTLQFNQGISGGTLSQPQFVLLGGNLRGGQSASGIPLSGVSGTVFIQSITTGSSLIHQFHCINAGIATGITQQLGTGGGVFTSQVFITNSVIKGTIANTTSPNSGSMTLYASLCDRSSSGSLGAVTGAVNLNILNNIRFTGTVVTTGGGGRWTNTFFTAGSDFTGSSATVVADQSSIGSFISATTTGTRGSMVFTPADVVFGTTANRPSGNLVSGFEYFDTTLGYPIWANGSGSWYTGSALTTKGDIYCYSTKNDRLPVGTDGYLLSASSAQGTGLEWIAPSSSSSSVQNRLFNGSMLVFQRQLGNAGSLGTSGYALDRWQWKLGTGGSSFSITQQTATSPYIIYQRVLRNTNTVSTFTLAQSLTRSMCIGLAGHAVTLQFHAMCGSGYTPASSFLNVQIVTGTSTVSDVSNLTTGFTGANTVINQNAVLTTNDQLFTYTTASLASNVTVIAVQFQASFAGNTNANDWFQITNTQLELGATANTYQYEDFTDELAMCLPFYQKSFPYSGVASTSAGDLDHEIFLLSGTTLYASIDFQAPVLNQAGTLTFYNPVNNNNQAYDKTLASDYSGTSAFFVSTTKFTVTATPPIGFGLGNLSEVAWSYDCDIT